MMSVNGFWQEMKCDDVEVAMYRLVFVFITLNCFSYKALNRVLVDRIKITKLFHKINIKSSLIL